MGFRQSFRLRLHLPRKLKAASRADFPLLCLAEFRAEWLFLTEKPRSTPLLWVHLGKSALAGEHLFELLQAGPLTHDNEKITARDFGFSGRIEDGVACLLANCKHDDSGVS
jgi:hypothetical protein